ncbi:MAG TPA: response regulator [Gemmatales bacterium]|nr:response regulator [Gemmatales bacterium]HMP15729.1 response regulator [Gemmatales bacterium]
MNTPWYKQLKFNADDKASTESVAESTHQLFYCPADVRILIIDDETAICQVIERALAQPHFAIDTVSQHDKIDTALKNNNYNLIIMDYVLPGVDPNALFDKVKTNQPDASVIVMTGYPSVDSALNSLRARAYDYITKPFDINKLRETVHRCLESKGILRMSEDALRENLGKVLRDRRKGMDLTLAQLSDRTKVSLGYLSQIELGKNSASIETLYKICLGLGIKMSELFIAIRA